MDGSEERRRRYDIKIVKKVPESIPFLIGDVVHNLRSALDHVAYEIVKGRGKTPSQGLVFPIKDTRKEVIDSIKSEIQAAARSDLVSFLIDSVQPYQRGKGHPLWVLHRLDCIDKHREMLPAVDFITLEHMVAVDDEGTTYTGISLKWTRGGHLKLPNWLHGKNLRFQHDGSIAVGVQFENVECADGEMVVPLLNRLRVTVANTIRDIAKVYIA